MFHTSGAFHIVSPIEKEVPPGPAPSAVVKPLALRPANGAATVNAECLLNDDDFLWSFSPFFQRDGRPLGTLIVHHTSRRALRADPNAIVGGGVTLVELTAVDANCGWVFGIDKKLRPEPFVPIISLTTFGGRWMVLNITGNDPESGAKVVTYPHDADVPNDVWQIRWQR